MDILKKLFSKSNNQPITTDTKYSNYRVDNNPFWNEILSECDRNNFVVTNVYKGHHMEIITPESEAREADHIVKICGCDELLAENLQYFAETIHRKCHYQDKEFFVTIVDREIKKD